MVYEIETKINSDIFNELGFDEEVIRYLNNANIKLLNKHDEFNFETVCFNYALVNDWICCCREAYNLLEDEYEQINIRNAKNGDIISYHEISDFKNKYEKPCSENALHFAMIKNTNGTLKSTIIKSKWGIDGVFESNLFDVPDCYGNAIVIWRKIKK